MPAILKKILKILLWIIASIVILFIIIVLLIRMPAVQEYIVNKAEPMVEKKIGTRFDIRGAYISFPDNVTVEGLYVEDLQKDTLASIGNLEVDIGLFGLFNSELNINNVLLENAVVNLLKDSTTGKFNFDFIIESFQGDTTQKQEKESSWTIFAGGLDLKNTRFTYVDQTSLEVKTRFQALSLDISRFDLDSMNFAADQFSMANASLVVKSFGDDGPEATLPSPTEEKQQANITLAVENFEIENSHIQYADGAQKAVADIGGLVLTDNFFSLHRQEIKAGSVALENSFAGYQKFVSDTSQQKPSQNEDESRPWKINVLQVKMTENEIKFDNSRLAADSVPGMNFNHLHINGMGCDVRDIAIKGTDISADIEHLQLAEKSGFTLNQLALEFQMRGERIQAENFSMETDSSSVSANATFFMTSFLENKVDINSSSIQINEAVIYPQDVFYFVPTLQKSISGAQTIRLEGNVKGWLDSLDINKLAASINNTSIKMQGQLIGLPELHEVYFDIPKITLKGYSPDVVSILPDTAIPQNVRLPREFDVTAAASGAINDLRGYISGVTSLGNIYFEGSFRNDTIEKYVDVNGDLEIEQFNVGKLIQNRQLRKLSANFSVDGAGEDLSNTNIEIAGNIALLQYNNYNYKDLEINGNIMGRSYRGKLSSEDENLRFYFNGLVDMQDSIPRFDLRLDLIHADLRALNFSQSQLVTSGVLTAQINTDDDGRINGNAAIRRAKVIKEGEFFAIDSMIVVSISEKANTDIKFNSPILNARLSGQVDMNKIGSVLKRHVDQYFSEDLTTDSLEGELQEFNFFIDMVDPTILTDVFLPELETLKISAFEGYFNNLENRLTVDVDIPKVHYGSFKLDTLEININSSDRRLTGNLSFDLFKSDMIHIENFDLSAASAEKALNLLATIPLQNKRDFQAGARLYRKNKNYFVSLRPETLVFNGQAWTAPEDNYLKIGEGIWFNNFAMQNGNKQISVNSRLSDAQDTTLYLDFQNFELSALAEPVSDTVSLVSGVASGNFHLLSENDDLSFESALNISNLSVVDNLLGSLNFDNRYRQGVNVFELAIKGEKADMQVDGNLWTEDTTMQLEAAANINKLELSIIHPFVRENFQKLEGSLSGNIDFKTAEGLPEIDGRINFSQVNLIPTFTGVELNIDDQQIRIDNERVVLNEFKINAPDDGSVVLDGNLNARDFPDYQVSLSLTADNFLVLNTTEDDHEMYYGVLRIDATGELSGDQNLQKVNANVEIVEGSELVYVVPQQQASVISGEGLVRYINVRTGDMLEEQAEMQQDTATARIEGVDLAANISINKESRLSVIIDQQTGDRLDVAGDANLTLNMPPNADMSLTGRYEISEGSYKLNFYEFVKREFEIVEGSYILWTGDPLEAQLDVITRYEVETLPPLSDISRRLPFYVNLNVEEKILEPQLSFSLSLPEDLQQEYSNVSSFLQNINSQESELNKQVFSLIVFNSFMISGGGGSGDLVSNTARQSLSKILSQQLNKLAGNVDFVELDVNLESYETGDVESAEGRTDLELGLSKSLFNDRVVVRVEGNVNLEGEEQARQGMSNYSGDIIIEYKLTPDGVYRLQVFSKNEYDPLDQGDITKTGVGVIMIRDYNHIRELFRRDKTVE